ncbi:hypothetical protein Salat_1908500 [Sesamum alatum]|uniref:Uncharacterized protein n=1 Tax=Sesamum alatum TaxID=300844 RepID=A0AAE2CID1_9LAMI|nr:hypothetical protein Salat_1908500 [Sesamum alatum]
MAAGHDQHSRKICRKRRSWCSFLKACFGRPPTDTEKKYVGKFLKFKRKKSSLVRTVPISHSTFTTSSSYVTGWRDTSGHQVIITNKIDDQILEKSKNLQTTNRKSSDSVPPPQPRRKREKATAVDGGRKGKFDSWIGAVITTVTLTVMLIWGKACAVVCMAAWFYIIPRLITTPNYYYNQELRNSSNDEGEFDSWDYKKRVVLQGLLERNQHVRASLSK